MIYMSILVVVVSGWVFLRARRITRQMDTVGLCGETFDEDIAIGERYVRKLLDTTRLAGFTGLGLIAALLVDLSPPVAGEIVPSAKVIQLVALLVGSVALLFCAAVEEHKAIQTVFSAQQEVRALRSEVQRQAWLRQAEADRIELERQHKEFWANHDRQVRDTAQMPWRSTTGMP